MKGYYRIGAKTPSDIHIPLSRDSYNLVTRGIEARNLATDTGRIANGVIRASNLATGHRGRSGRSYYLAGCAGNRSDIRAHDPEVGALVATPGFLMDELDRLLGEIRSIDRDIVSKFKRLACSPDMTDGECGELNRFIQNTWSPFLKEYIEFRKGHLHWWQRLWGGLYDTIQEYRKRARGLRKVAEGIGVEFTAPPPDKPDPGSFSRLADFIKSVMIYGLIGFALWLGFKLFTA